MHTVRTTTVHTSALAAISKCYQHYFEWDARLKADTRFATSKDRTAHVLPPISGLPELQLDYAVLSERVTRATSASIYPEIDPQILQAFEILVAQDKPEEQGGLNYQERFVMTWRLGLRRKPAEIAHALHISERTVYSYFNSALLKLARALSDGDEEIY